MQIMTFFTFYTTYDSARFWKKNISQVSVLSKRIETCQVDNKLSASRRRNQETGQNVKHGRGRTGTALPQYHSSTQEVIGLEIMSSEKIEEGNLASFSY